MTRKKIRVLLVPVRQYKQIFLAYSENDAAAYVERFNEDECAHPVGMMAVADVHGLTSKANRGRRRVAAGV